MSDYITGEDIEAYCGSCPNRTKRISNRSGQPYDFCRSFLSPVFKVLNICQEQRAGSWRPEKIIVQTKFNIDKIGGNI
jgi:hypothetical protein